MKFSLSLEDCRFTTGEYATKKGDTFGAFLIPFESQTLKVIASDGEGLKPKWEHVSVSLRNRCPNWKEMCFIKGLFWDKDEVVIQFHPADKDYINQHPYCLHLWRPVDFKIETPPSIYTGIKKDTP